MPTNADQSLFSRQREKLVEHLFTGELWRALWVSGARDTEVLSPQIDDAGYDVVVQPGRVVRHIQLKTSRLGGKARGQKVHVRLADKPGGCVVWIFVNEETMELGPYLWFGGRRRRAQRAGAGGGPGPPHKEAAPARRPAEGRAAGRF